MTDAHDRPTSEDRRALLKKAIVAGGLAWAAPVVTTLSSPAFAATTSGVNRFEFTTSGTAETPVVPTASACAPAGWTTFDNDATGPADSGGMTVGGNANNTITVTAPAGCTITGATGVLSTGGCVTGTVTGGGTGATIDDGGGSQSITRTRVLATCS